MITTKRIDNCSVLHRVLAWVQLTLVVNALAYAGLHQFNNPAVLVEDCALVTHHLHQNPDTHQCDLCDYHLRFYQLDSSVEIIAPHYHKELVITEVMEPVIDIIGVTTTRGPPIS